MAKTNASGAGRDSAAVRRRRFSTPWRWVNLGVAFVIIVILVGPAGRGPLFDYEPGVSLPRSLRAPFDLEVVDEQAQDEMRRRLLENAPKLFLVDGKALTRSEKTLDEILELAQAAAAEATEAGNAAASDRPRLSLLIRALREAGLSDPEAAAEALEQRGASDRFAADARRHLQHLLVERGVIDPTGMLRFRAAESSGQLRWSRAAPPATPYSSANLLEYKDNLRTYLRRTYLPPLYRDQPQLLAALEDLLASVAEPVVVFDLEGTDLERQHRLQVLTGQARKKILRQGDLLVPAGTVVTAEHETLLEAFRKRGKQHEAVSLTGVAALVGVIFVLVAFYSRKFPGEAPFTASGVILISFPVIIAFGLWRLVGVIGVGEDRLWGFGFPAALIGMLGVALMGPRLAWLLITCAGLLYGIASDLNFTYAMPAFLGGFTAITSLYSTQTRRDIVLSGARVGIVNALVIVALLVVADPTGFNVMAALGPALSGLGNGLACGALAMPLIWLFERAFGVVTDFTLLELTGIHHPLLRDLEEKAPGTYQHTLNVTKLAESAATAIGANYLLVRAGGYFHDVGKMVKPRYFSENQATQEDRAAHSKLSPRMSTLIIKNHVKEGLEIARQHALPPEITAFIAEHHGSSLISYFYHQAVRQFQESQSTDPVREEDFRYPGPKPQTIETAIVMLADSVEATVTSVFTSSNVNEDELRRVVRDSINEKFSDGQFDECDLTLRDLHIITEMFVKTLLGRFHHRVAYPSPPRNGERRR